MSTDEVFGSLGKDGLFSAASPYRPRSPYSAAKASSDHFVRAYGNTYGMWGVEKFLSDNLQTFVENVDSSMNITFKGGLKIILEGHNTEAIPGNNQEKVKKFWFF